MIEHITNYADFVEKQLREHKPENTQIGAFMDGADIYLLFDLEIKRRGDIIQIADKANSSNVIELDFKKIHELTVSYYNNLISAIHIDMRQNTYLEIMFNNG